MKHLFYVIVSVLLISVIGSCDRNKALKTEEYNSADTAIMQFTEYVHDFGKIVSGEKVAALFTFQNTGKGPLIINNVTTSCGCTVARYSRKPIKPGETGSLEVVFNSDGYNGVQRKTVIVQSNASQPVILLTIIAEVIQNNN